MLSCAECVNKSIPEEYRSAAEQLFPSGGQAGSPEGAKVFAEILGVSTEYHKCLEVRENGRDLGDYLQSFQNNLELLIQKTWVEKADEFRKERLLDRLPSFIAGIERGEYSPALEEFGEILEELAYLFFGAQSSKDDFTEYTFRIDTQMGLFWWYGSRIGSPHSREWARSADKKAVGAVLFLGICYLTNF